MLDPFQLEFVQRGVLELLLLCTGAGLLGTWIVLRGLAFHAHASGSATFPGLVLADGLGFAAPLGALAAAIAFALAVAGLGRSRRAIETTIALVLVGALSLGVILASDVFHSGSGIETLLFGSLLTIEDRDLWLAGAASGVTLLATVLLGRAWLASGFDADAARALGLRSALPDLLLMALIALVVTATISAVGALMTASLLVVPAATVRLWTSRLPAWQATTVLLVAIEGAVGLWLSVELNAPPGATIAVLSGGVFACAALARVARGRRALAVAAALAGTMALGACGSNSSGSSATSVNAVATTTLAADWVREVGGERVKVHGILRPNTDPHDYEPRPTDVEAVSKADVVFKSGDGLDDWVDKLVGQGGGDAVVVDLSAGLPGLRKGDPHWWQDPRNVDRATASIADALAQVDRAHAATFERSAARYRDRLDRLGTAVDRCMQAVPRPERRLVTDHDAFSYFASRYGIEVVGAVIPARTGQAQPSARDVARLVNLIRREHVRAVFPEHALSDRLARSIARETGANAGFTLYADTLGPAGSAGDTFLKMFASNADSMVRGFSGGSQRCRPAT